MSRVQLALNVNDIDEAVSFYTALFGTGPAKRKPGYANFAITEPPLKLVLLENPGQGGTLNHLGVEVDSADAVDAEQARLAGAGLAAIDERGTTCCYARQDKFWVTGAPGGERWEIYTVLADSAAFWGQDDEQRSDAVQAELDGGQATQCCGGPRSAGEEPGSASAAPPAVAAPPLDLPSSTATYQGAPRGDAGRYPVRAGGSWLCRTLLLSLFQAVVVPSGFRTRVQPRRWIAIWWWNR
jgi:catechol 2,3-dioxygenase-like lactoylglutathione lyase family enzyme